MGAVSAEPASTMAVAGLPWGRPLTEDDLEELPSDGHRYELVDGVLVVTPAPSEPHQSAVVALAVLLAGLCPPELKLLVAPFDVRLAADTVLQPDVLVCRRGDLTRRNLPASPVLAVEVLSPSTRRIDLALKRSRYEAAGCPSYWVVDPDVPSIVAWELHGSAYVEAGHAQGTDTLRLELPFAVELTPSGFDT